MRMLSLKRQDWIWLLPAALLCLLPGNAAAQNSYQPVSDAEGKCVVSTAQDWLQNNPQMRQQVDQMLSQVRAQSCQSGEQAAMQQLGMMTQALVGGMYQPLIQKCFPALAQQQEAQGREKLNTVIELIYQITAQTLMQTVPRPLCR